MQKGSLVFFGDCSNINSLEKKISDRYYTELVKVKSDCLFEFSRLNVFFSKMFGGNISLSKPSFSLSDISLPKAEALDVNALSTPYVLIAPGTSAKARQFSPAGFAKIASFLSAHYYVYIVGAPFDKVLADELVSLSGSERVISLAGKDHLYELPFLFHGAKLVVCNDSMAFHLAAAVNLPVVLLSNGENYGRFCPYPREIYDKVLYCFPPKMQAAYDGAKELSEPSAAILNLDINTIDVDELINRLSVYCHS